MNRGVLHLSLTLPTVPQILPILHAEGAIRRRARLSRLLIKLADAAVHQRGLKLATVSEKCPIGTASAVCAICGTARWVQPSSGDGERPPLSLGHLMEIQLTS